MSKIHFDRNIINLKTLEDDIEETDSSDSGIVIFYEEEHPQKHTKQTNKEVEEFEKEMYRTLTFNNFHRLVLDCIHNKNNEISQATNLNIQEKNDLKQIVIQYPDVFMNLQESFYEVVTNKKIHSNTTTDIVYSEYRDISSSSNQTFEIMKLYHVPFLFYYVSQIYIPTKIKISSNNMQLKQKKMSDEPYFVFNVCKLLLTPYMYVYPEKRDVLIDILQTCTALLLEYKQKMNPHARYHEYVKSNYFTSSKNRYINEKEILYHVRKTSKLYMKKNIHKKKGRFPIFSSIFETYFN